MIDLQAKLEQAQRDHVACNESFRAEIANLKQQIADSEVTYSVGDKFKEGDGDKEFLLVGLMSNDGAGLIQAEGRDSGFFWTGELYTVRNLRCITQAEFTIIKSNTEAIRTWDARKQCKC